MWEALPCTWVGEYAEFPRNLPGNVVCHDAENAQPASKSKHGVHADGEGWWIW
jgi:hypothetical protein